jgi:hypothetical protein
MRHYAIYDSPRDGHADILTGPCPFCHQRGWITVPQLGADALTAGHPIHDALPYIDPRLREQITSGIHPRCFPGAEFGDGIDPDLIRP